MAVFTLLSSTTSFPAPTTTTTTTTIPSASPTEIDSYLVYQTHLPLNFQLPKQEQSDQPFYAPEPVTYLVAPQEIQEPDYYRVPIPAQDLVAPTDTEWNPKRDPSFYYEVPAVLTRQELPTKEYPKKFNEAIHAKPKPHSVKPKEEVVLEPINEKQYEEKQKDLEKTFLKFTKKQNQKEVQAVKVPSAPKSSIKTKVPTKPTIDTKPVNDAVASGSGYVDQAPAPSYDQGLSGDITASLGIPHSPHAGERLVFHVVGHDGPHSYKWGFDTGKG